MASLCHHHNPLYHPTPPPPPTIPPNTTITTHYTTHHPVIRLLGPVELAVDLGVDPRHVDVVHSVCPVAVAEDVVASSYKPACDKTKTKHNLG